MIKKFVARYNNLSASVKSSAFFVVSSLLTQGIHVITTPLYTNLLSTTEIGIVNKYNSYDSILGTIIGMGFVSGAYSIAMNEYREKRDQYSSAVLTLSILISTVACIVMVLLRRNISILMGIDERLVVLMGIGFIISPARSMWNAKQRFELKYRTAFLVSIGTVVLSTIVTLAAILMYKKSENINLGSVKVFFSSIVPYSVAAIIACYLFLKGRCFSKKEYWTFAISTGLPMVIHSIAKVIFDGSDRIMISNYCGDSATGIYGTIYNISSVASILWIAINGSLVPYIFDNLRVRNDKNIKRVTGTLLILYAVGCIILTLVGPEIISVLTTKEYAEGCYIVPPVAAGVFFTALYNMYSTVLLYYKKTTQIMFSTVIAAITNVVLNVVFIPIFGYIAAAYTTLISYIILAITQYFFMKAITKENIYNGVLFAVLSVGVVLLAITISGLYRYPLVRYTCGLIILCTILVARKRILSIVHIMRER